MRVLAALVLIGASGGAGAQVATGEAGACTLATGAGQMINAGTCVKMPARCNAVECDVSYVWQRDQFSTVVTGPGAMARVAQGSAMNGQKAYAPGALVRSDPRDCIYNPTTDGVFCWMPGVEAFTLAAGDPVMAFNALRASVGLGPAAAPTVQAGGDEEEGPGPGLLEALQGTYKFDDSWNCRDIGMDGGAIAVQGSTYVGVENQCQLSNLREVGQHGTLLADADCTGEGTSWQDEYLLHRDEFGTLAVIRGGAIMVLRACE